MNFICLTLLILANVFVVGDLSLLYTDVQLTPFDWSEPGWRMYISFVAIAILRTFSDHFFSNYGILSQDESLPDDGEGPDDSF